jgi:hypothetical protein
MFVVLHATCLMPVEGAKLVPAVEVIVAISVPVPPEVPE